jgi:hypothetical protein
MSIVKSALLGTPGYYRVADVPVEFKEGECSVKDRSILGKFTSYFTSNRFFQLATFGYTHVFVHEMGHALAAKLVSPKLPEVTVYTTTCTGGTRFYGAGRMRAAWKNTFITAAGSMTDIAFSIGNIVVINGLQAFLPWPVSLALKAGNAFWITGEVLYAVSSAIQRNDGDFGQILNDEPLHFPIASVALVAEAALGLGLCFL